MHLLNSEISFSTSLGVTLERLQAIQRTLESVQRAIHDGNSVDAVELLGHLEEDLKSVSFTRSTRISDVLEAKVTDIRDFVKEQLTHVWYRHILIDSARSSIHVKAKVEGAVSNCPFRKNFGADLLLGPDLDSLVTVLKRSNSYMAVLQPLCLSLESMILLPRLQMCSDRTVDSIEIDRDKIYISGRSSDLSALTLFQDLSSVIQFLRTRLPPSICEPLADFLMPRMISKLISTWLGSAVPEDLDGIEDFEDTLSLVKEFGKTLDTYNWPGKRDLTKWIEGIPGVWLRKRQEISLDHVRKMLARGLGGIETVERVETQVLSRNDEVFKSSGGGDDWNAGWSDEETSPTEPKGPSIASKAPHGNDEEDVSAWDLDEDKDLPTAQDGLDTSDATDEGAEAWGWGNDNEGEESIKSPEDSNSSPKKLKANGPTQVAQQAEREVTLRETYNITSLPKDMLETISQVIFDAIRLETPDYASLPIASAGPDLLSLPGLILAMYRAGSSTSYSRYPSGQMFFYNDSLWLAEHLNQLYSGGTTASGRRIPSRMAYNLKLLEHTSALESFGKRAYAKEMESQRTIITDLLDGAQGFVHCTEHPFAGEIDLAIASTVDRLRQLHREWKDVLSQSALLQSLGSLLSTATNKMIVDIEDMPDISEPESQQLTTYCNRIATLEDLFRQAQESQTSTRSGDQDAMPLTPLYAPHWLKFQYLANILESSLVDIKYLWTEGELGLEFDTEEVVDLIVALFADSPHRRAAVAEIRRRRGVR